MIEYRVVWQREGLKPKFRIYKRRSSAEMRVGLLTDPEPWKFIKKAPDSYACCSGRECGCGGLTVKADAIRQRARMIPLLYVRIEARRVGEWEVQA